MTDFETPPTVPLWKTAIQRSTGTVIPRTEARARSLPGDPAPYAAVCGIALGDHVPICFPDLLCRGLQLSVLTSPAFPVRLLGIVHVRQQIEQHRSIRRDEPLSGHVWVEGSRAARKGGEFDLHTVVHAGETEVWHGITTILSRDLPALPSVGDRPGERPAQTDPFVADQFATWSLPEDLGRRYAKVSGDVNPIHQYAWTAKMFGFKRAIIHGWWTLARCLAELDEQGGGAAPARVDARFLAPVPLPSSATFSAGPSPGDARGFTVRSGDRLAVVGTAHPNMRTAKET